jgi:hypothetical protein
MASVREAHEQQSSQKIHLKSLGPWEVNFPPQAKPSMIHCSLAVMQLFPSPSIIKQR